MAAATQDPDFDAIVIGAGFGGIHMLKSLRDMLGLKVRVYEAGGGVGGTWYWNRYPGARCDSDSYVYCFTWDRQLLQDWGVVGTVSGAAGDPALPGTRRDTPRPEARHAVRYVGDRRRVRRRQ